MQHALSTSNQQVSMLESQLSELRHTQASLQASLEGKQSAEASLGSQLIQVGPFGLNYIAQGACQRKGAGSCGSDVSWSVLDDMPFSLHAAA